MSILTDRAGHPDLVTLKLVQLGILDRLEVFTVLDPTHVAQILKQTRCAPGPARRAFRICESSRTAAGLVYERACGSTLLCRLRSTTYNTALTIASKEAAYRVACTWKLTAFGSRSAARAKFRMQTCQPAGRGLPTGKQPQLLGGSPLKRVAATIPVKPSNSASPARPAHGCQDRTRPTPIKASARTITMPAANECQGVRKNL